VDLTLEHPDGTVLAAHWARPASTGSAPGLVLCHDFPTPPRGSLASGLTFPELADRIAAQAGWRVLTFNFRGTGGSRGDFSVGGWNADLRFAVDRVVSDDDDSGVWIAGTGVGGALALGIGAGDPRVRGVAALGAPVDLRDWSRDAQRFARHCRSMGVFESDRAPEDTGAWSREMAAVDSLASARRFAPRPLLVLHGTEDDVVPVTDAERLADAHQGAELRVLTNGGRRLRHDPRAVALLLGWLDRQVL
jgi:pimeloyl-ACP methyl ester carboxylesterase